MSRAAALSAAILETVVARLAVLFLAGAGGDIDAAREAARQMLAGYGPETDDELRLAAEIISFGFHALEALSQAASPTASVNQQLRLRGSVVSLSRESHKSQRTLNALQNARRAGTPIEPVAVAQRPRIDRAIALVETTREAIAANPAKPPQTWTQSYQQRQRDKRIADRLKKNATAVTMPTAPQAAALSA